MSGTRPIPSPASSSTDDAARRARSGAILVALIQLGDLLSIRPDAAAIAFGGVVIVTMLAAESFDPRLIWDEADDASEGVQAGIREPAGRGGTR